MRYIKKCPDCGEQFKSKREDATLPLKCKQCLSSLSDEKLKEMANAPVRPGHVRMEVYPTFMERELAKGLLSLRDRIKDLEREKTAAWSQVEELLAERKNVAAKERKYLLEVCLRGSRDTCMCYEKTMANVALHDKQRAENPESYDD